MYLDQIHPGETPQDGGRASISQLAGGRRRRARAGGPADHASQLGARAAGAGPARAARATPAHRHARQTQWGSQRRRRHAQQDH